MFGQMGIKAKLFTTFMLVSFLNVLVGAVNYIQFQKVATTYNHIATVNMKKSEAIAYMRIFFRGVRIEVRTLGLAGLTAEEERHAIERVHHEIENYDVWKKKYAELPFSPGEESLFKKNDEVWNEFKNLGLHVIDLTKNKSSENSKRMLEIFMQDCPDLAKKYAVVNQELVDFQNKESETWSETAIESVHSTNFITIAIVVVSFCAAFLLGFWLSTNLANNLNKLADKLSNGAGHVADAAGQISQSSEALAGTSSRQSSALQQTASSVHEMSAMVNKNAQNANRSRELAAENQSAAEGGKEIVDEMINAIGEISESNNEIMRQTEQSNHKIAEIVNVITEIGNKTKVINDIVFQTKLLSFNASVEAARAGEHGKGFAVVAEEVGNLAQMSGNAAQEIKNMLEASIQRVNTIVQETQSQISSQVAIGREKVARGTDIAKRCGEVLEKIVDNVSTANSMAGEIATASSEQANGVREISNAMSELEHVTHQNTEISEQAEKASQELTSQADGMREIVLELLRTIRGGNMGEVSDVSQGYGVNKKVLKFRSMAAETHKKTDGGSSAAAS